MFRLVRRLLLVALGLAVVLGFARNLTTLFGALLSWSLMGYLLVRAWPAVRSDAAVVWEYVRRLLPVAAPGAHARRGGAETL